ncbi:hypothetical protein [uncultured Planococcus sp.]|nr:hypothetical protein [uncultured Planococcus sp.]
MTSSKREFRDIAGIGSPSIASKLVTGMMMPRQGSFKDRHYVIPEAF